MISLVVFLGNYGKQYEKTRHNAAWIFAESLPFTSSLNTQKKFKGVYASLDGQTVQTYAQNAAQTDTSALFTPYAASTKTKPKLYFLWPETYMNLSGESIGELATFFKIPAEEILVIHDELELPCGTVSLKWSGGLGGHNGLRSTKEVLGTADFWRLRIGIGRPTHADIAGYVLSPFTDDERIVLAQAFPALSNLLLRVLTNDPNSYLKQWSKKKLDA